MASSNFFLIGVLFAFVAYQNLQTSTTIVNLNREINAPKRFVFNILSMIENMEEIDPIILEMKANPGYPVKKKNGNIKSKLTSVLKFDSVPILPPLAFDTTALIDYRFDRLTLTFQPQGLLQPMMHVEDIWSVKSKGEEKSKLEMTSVVSTPYMLKATTRRGAFKVGNIILDRIKRMAERDFERYVQEHSEENLNENSIEDTYIPGVSDGASAHDPESTPIGRRR